MFDEDDNQSAKKSDNDFNDSIRRNYSNSDIANLENETSTGINSDTKNTQEQSESKSVADAASENSFYQPSKQSQKSKSGGSSSLRSNRKKIIIGTSIAGFICSAVFGILAYIPLQVAHIKEVFRGSYGGTQEATLLKRKMRLYNRAYFFRNDGEFDGFREKGVFGFIKNRSSTKLINDLESKGFKVKADLTPEGKWTGKFSSLEYKGEVITSSNSSVWERRSAIRTVLAEEYPTRGYMWRSKAARKVYSRYGLNRSSWWTDNAATRKIDAVEARFRSKVRNALNRKPPVDLGVDAPKSGTDSDGNSTNPDQDRANIDEANAAKGELDANTRASIDADVNATRPPNPISELVEDGAKNLDDAAVSAGTKSVLGALKITGATEAACTGIKTLNQIESGSRTIKRLQLIKSFSVYMSLVDAVRTGNVDSKDVGAFMSLMTSRDPDTGKNAYQSGGWLWASKGRGKEPRYGNTFNTGGGTTGVLKNFRTTAYSLVGGAGSVESTCDTVSNGFFQIGSAIVGIGAAIATGGTFTAGNFVANFAITTAVEMVRSFATPLLTNLAAGTIVNGWEKGEKFGDMLSAASGSSYYAQGSQLGLRPLKKAEKTALMNEYDGIIKDEQSLKPMYARLFDVKDTRSLLSVAILNSPKNVNDLASMAINPLKIFHGRAVAAEEGYECNDEEVVNNDIATDPFCNPILGETSIDSIDPIENIKWMLQNNYIDDDGNPQGDYSEYVSKCFENSNIETLFEVKDFTTTYNETCTSSGTNGQYARFRAYHIDHNLISCMDEELDQGHCDAGAQGNAGSDPTGTTGNFVGIEGLSCSGYSKIKKSGETPVPGVIDPNPVGYSSPLVKQACQDTKAQCLAGVSGSGKALCAAYEFHDSWYGSTFLQDKNKLYYGETQPINALSRVVDWYKARKPGPNGNNLLECSALTTVAVYRAFNYSSGVGCSANWSQSKRPNLFKNITWEELKPGDFLTYSNTCNTSSGFGHVAIAASSVDANGNFVVFEQAAFGTTAHFRLANKKSWGTNAEHPTFTGALSRWIGPGL